MRARFEVLAVERIVNVTKSNRRAVAAEVKIMTEAVIERGAIGCDFRSLDHQIAVVVAHHPHVAKRDSAIAHSHVVAGSYSNARAVITIARILKLQILQRDEIRFDLKNRAWMRQHAIHDLVGPIENWPRAPLPRE